jgi:hypothetical protein
MQHKRPYSTPEIADAGRAADVTEGHESPVVDGQAGSGTYYDSSKGRLQETPPPDDAS